MEQKWLVRIVLRRVAVGLGARTILAALHPAANDVYARTTHLSLVCAALQQPTTGDPDHLPTVATSSDTDITAIRPGRPFQPMLCARVRMSALDALIAGHAHCAETKYDGERFQIHRLSDGTFRYYSRRGHDYTAHFDRSLSADLLRTRSALFRSATDAIVDGEMMVWDRQRGGYRTKAEHGDDVKALRPEQSQLLRPAFVAYDVLWLNGQCLVRMPYGERQRVLRDLVDVHADRGVLSRSEPVRVRDAEHVVRCVNEALDAREEGVVLKREDGAYVAGARTAGWCKVKPDVSVELMLQHCDPNC